MANRRSYGGNSNYGNSGGGGGGGRYSGGGGGVNPWQSGSSPGPRSLLSNNLLISLTPDSQLALATKLLTSILPVAQGGQPPSLMSLGGDRGNVGGYGGPRYGGGGGGYGNDRGYRRDDRRPNNDQYRNRRPQDNNRNRDRKPAEKPRTEKPKEEPKPDPKQEESAKAKEDAEPMEDEGERKERAEGPLPGYENIPTKLFHCHVCGKTMWNDVSFDTHVKGRNHRTKLREVEDGYQIQTDLMRQIAAISLKLEEIRRGGKRRPYPDQYCKMCDLHFNGMTMFAHRSTEEHQSLKRFIHPSCTTCNIDFQVRIEYDEHILTAEHLQGEAKALIRKEKYEKEPKYVAIREQEAKLRLLLEEVGDIGKGAVTGLSEEDQKLVEEVLGEEGKAPAYDPDSEVGVARHHITEASGYLCKVCKVFLLSSEVMDIHCRTQGHYESYVNQLKIEANKRSKDKDDGDKRKSGTDADGVGAPKRRKTDSGEDGVNGAASTKDETNEPMEISQEREKELLGEDEEEEKEEKKKPAARTPTARRGRGRGRK